MNEELDSLKRGFASFSRQGFLIFGILSICASIMPLLLGLLSLIFAIIDGDTVSFIVAVITLFIGIGVLVLGIVLLVIQHRKNNRKNSSIFLDATIVDCRIEYSMRNRGVGEHPYILICRHFLPNGQYYEFESEPIWSNPNYYLGKVVRVYSDSNDFFPYFVDIDSLG